MRQRIVKILKPLHAVSVENACGAGTPDINFVGGWIECKALPKWSSTIPHFTPQQRLWLRQRNKAGGMADVCLKVGRDWFLIDGAQAAQHLGIDWNKEDLVSYAAWLGRLDEEEFIGAVQSRIQTHSSPAPG